LDDLEKAEQMAEKFRQEPYSLFTNDCITKSFRLKRKCRAIGISSSVVICVGMATTEWFSRRLTIPVIHAWGEVAGKRIETSRPLGSAGIWGIVPADIKPLIAIWIR
jgi:hypothetical protein